MSLFVGNVSIDVDPRKIEDAFAEYGKVHFNSKGKYGFAEFEREEDAEVALEKMKDVSFGGRKLNIFWSKKSGKYDPKQDQRPKRKYSNDDRRKRRYSRSNSRDKSRDRSSDRYRDKKRRDYRRKRSYSSRSDSSRSRGHSRKHQPQPSYILYVSEQFESSLIQNPPLKKPLFLGLNGDVSNQFCSGVFWGTNRRFACRSFKKETWAQTKTRKTH